MAMLIKLHSALMNQKNGAKPLGIKNTETSLTAN